MKRIEEIKAWGRLYETALLGYLRRGPSASMRATARLGRQAAALGMETLDVAKIHERAWGASASSLDSPEEHKDRIVRAQRFFSETLVPIERTHRTAQQADSQVKELTRTLKKRKRETASSKRKLKRGIARRQSAEAASHEVHEEHAQLLKESHKLQQRLRYRLRKLMGLQEDSRQKRGRHLRDEIAQTLLALDVRLLALKEAGRAGMEILSKEIAETQGLVRQSDQTFTRLNHDSKIPK